MRSVELFVGAGGLGMGVSRAGFEPRAVIEWDRWACDTIRENRRRNLTPVGRWPEVTEGDVRDFDFGAVDGPIDLVSGGPPCQPFSLGGKHRAHRDRRDMFPEAIRAVRELAPRAFIFENVKGLTRATFADYLKYVRLQLGHPEITIEDDETQLEHLARLAKYDNTGLRNGLHYNIKFQVLNAANFGVAQKRERVFIVGFRGDLGIEWELPPETHSRNALLWSQWRSGEYWERHQIAKPDRPDNPNAIGQAQKMPAPPSSRPWKTVRDATGDLPDPERRPGRAAQMPDHQFQPGARPYPGHTGSPLDEPAKVLKAGVHGVPGGENMLRRPDGSVRYFTVRESARLQAFPDEFLFHGSWTETMRQLGNAVPVTLAEIVAKSVREQLEVSVEERATLQPARQTAPGREHGQGAARPGDREAAAA